MPPYSNLILDSTLVQDIIEMVRLHGGSASAIDVADIALSLPDLDPQLAVAVVSDLIRDDGRLRLAQTLSGSRVELLGEDAETLSLDKTDFVVVDVETTGAKTPPCRITEVGAYRISRGRIVAEFQTLVNPRTTIPPFIVQLTGITDQMVRQAPVFTEIVPRWLEFADTAVLVAHNAQFDVRFLNHEIAQVFPNHRMANAHLCTVSLSRRLLPTLPNHRLHTLAEHFAISIRNRHRAAGDALATAEIFLNMLDLLQRNGVRTLADVRRFRLKPHNQVFSRV